MSQEILNPQPFWTLDLTNRNNPRRTILRFRDSKVRISSMFKILVYRECRFYWWCLSSSFSFHHQSNSKCRSLLVFFALPILFPTHNLIPEV
jgi:hypothetical protein